MRRRARKLTKELDAERYQFASPAEAQALWLTGCPWIHSISGWSAMVVHRAVFPAL